MTHEALTAVLVETIDLLRQCGRPDRADWLAERLRILRRDDATAEVRKRAVAELHGVVLGMGGLMDIVVEPPSESKLSPRSARERLDELADKLFDLTR
ncbi:MAG: hypothetical protein J0I18_07290 [Actinobacteria bacterium]|nr:hypothetical protein [Actinomycetota bacterium]